ncbi:MAG: D-alanine--D-alanine ligase [Schwartzia sp.]|nr:D-alanine--D-alanine ligase [Schwartzia sp. (in: firmicutes)]
MKNRKIVVVMGGPSSEAEVSRRTGSAVLEALRSRGLEASGLELVPARFAADIQAAAPAIVFNAVHGAFGEDGRLQAVLELMQIPYTGSGVLASAMTMDKVMAKRVFLGAGISTPRACSYQTFQRQQNLAAIVAWEFSLPVVVKAATQGSSIGVIIVERKEDLAGAIDEAFLYGDEILVEEFIQGMEITVAVWGDGEKAECFPIIEITTSSGRYDYNSKYTVGASQHIIPARLEEKVAERARQTAIDTFRVCDCRGVARMDMMVSEDGVPYVIDVNTVPGMTGTSLVPDAGRAMGVEFPELCVRLLAMAGFSV